MKYPKPIADTTYEVYKSHLRQARKRGDKNAVKHWEDKIRLSFRPIPVDLDPDTVPEKREVAGVSKEEDGVLAPLTDAAYTAYCVNFKAAVERGDDNAASMWRVLIESAGREVPQLGQIGVEPRTGTQ